MTRPVDLLPKLKVLLEQRIVLLDGAMGTMIQAHKLGEADYRGKEFANHPKDLRLNNDLLKELAKSGKRVLPGEIHSSIGVVIGKGKGNRHPWISFASLHRHHHGSREPETPHDSSYCSSNEVFTDGKHTVFCGARQSLFFARESWHTSSEGEPLPD